MEAEAEMAMNRNTEISLELTRLLNQQTEFFQNSALDESTPEELQVFKQSRERVRGTTQESGVNDQKPLQVRGWATSCTVSASE